MHILGLCAAAVCVISIEDFADRSSLLVALLLTTIASKLVVSSFVPKLPYPTHLDTYVLLCFVSIAFLLLESFILRFCWIIHDNHGVHYWLSIVDYVIIGIFVVFWFGVNIWCYCKYPRSKDFDTSVWFLSSRSWKKTLERDSNSDKTILGQIRRTRKILLIILIIFYCIRIL